VQLELHARLISWSTKENRYDPNSFSGHNTDQIINNKSQSLTTLQKNGCQATKQTKEHVIKQTKKQIRESKAFKRTTI
jgi:hypothetical protein